MLQFQKRFQLFHHHLNVSNTTLLSVLFLAPLSHYWNINVCLWLACYQPLLLAWLELWKCVQIFYYYMCHGWGNVPQLSMKTWWKDTCRGMLGAIQPHHPCRKALQTHSWRHPNSGDAKGQGPIGFTFKCPPKDPPDYPLWPHPVPNSQCHLPTRTGIAFFNCWMISLGKTSHLNESPLNGYKNVHPANLLLFNKKTKLTETPRILPLLFVIRGSEI